MVMECDKGGPVSDPQLRLAACGIELQWMLHVVAYIVARHADPGTTLVAGQAVLEIIAPDSLWIDARFDQVSAGGLAAGLPARITLRSEPDGARSGRVLGLLLTLEALRASPALLDRSQV